MIMHWWNEFKYGALIIFGACALAGFCIAGLFSFFDKNFHSEEDNEKTH